MPPKRVGVGGRWAAAARLVDDAGNAVGSGNPLATTEQRGVFKVATALVTGVASGAYATIVEFTPVVPVVIIGYNADFKAIASVRYRMRLTLNGTGDSKEQHAEELTTDANSWIPLQLSVSAGSVVRVQVFHSELAAQDVCATINYYEET